MYGKICYNGRYKSRQHCYRNHTNYNIEDNNKAGGIIMCMILYYSVEGGKQEQVRGDYNVHSKMHYNGRCNSGQQHIIILGVVAKQEKL